MKRRNFLRGLLSVPVVAAAAKLLPSPRGPRTTVKDIFIDGERIGPVRPFMINARGPKGFPVLTWTCKKHGRSITIPYVPVSSELPSWAYNADKLKFKVPMTCGCVAEFELPIGNDPNAAHYGLKAKWVRI